MFTKKSAIKLLDFFLNHPSKSSCAVGPVLGRSCMSLYTPSLRSGPPSKHFWKGGLKRSLLILSLFLQTIPIKAFSASESEILAVAKVNNQIITNIDLMDRYKFAIATSKIKVNSKQEANLLRNQLLQKMIDEKLIIEEAKNYEISASDEEAKDEIIKIAHDQGKNIEQLKSFFIKNDASYQNYLEQIKSQILWAKIVNEVIAPKLKAGESEIKEAMELRKISPDVTQLLLAEIYIPFDYEVNKESIDAKILARKLADELKSGKNFKSIVKQFSRSPSLENYGEIGWFGKNDLDPKIYQAVAKIKIGEVSDPVLLNNGYYLFKILDKRIVNNNLSDQDIKVIKADILSQKLQIAIRSFVIDLRKKSFVEINKEKIKSL